MITKKHLQLKFDKKKNTGIGDERDFGEEPTNVDRVLPVLQRLCHDQGVDVGSVLPVLIMLQRRDSKDINISTCKDTAIPAAELLSVRTHSQTPSILT